MNTDPASRRVRRRVARTPLRRRRACRRVVDSPRSRRWEAVEFGGRKLPLVLIALFINDVVLKCVIGVLTIGGVMAANFAYAPYVKRAYDRLDQVCSLTEVLIFLFGLCGSYRHKTLELQATGLTVDVFDKSRVMDSLVITCVCITIGTLFVGGVVDGHGLFKDRMRRQLRERKGVGETGEKGGKLHSLTHTLSNRLLFHHF